MNKLRTWFWTKVYNFKYRNISDDLCCCGAEPCYDQSHSFRSAKEYHVTTLVKSKVVIND